MSTATATATTTRPADARHAIANLRDVKDRAHAMYWREEITLDQLDGIIEHINGEIMAIQEGMVG